MPKLDGVAAYIKALKKKRKKKSRGYGTDEVKSRHSIGGHGKYPEIDHDDLVR